MKSWKILGPIGGAVMAVVIGFSAAGLAQSVSYPMTTGQRLTVTCNGQKLTPTKKTTTSYLLACTGKAKPVSTTTTTKPTPPRTTVPPPPVTTSPTTLPPVTTAPTTVPPVTSSWWTPSTARVEWQWYLAGTLNTSNATQMGIGDKTYTGAAAGNPTVYDIDGIDNSAGVVSSLHALGAHVICYVEVGTAGDYYSAADEGTASTYYDQLSAAGDFGNKLKGYPESFLNINSSSTVSIIESMISKQCAAKHFDAVETDLDETFNSNEGKVGTFSISEANEEAYMTTLANYMHGLGLGWIIKNPDDVGDASYANAMEPLADGVLSEQCAENNSCQFLGAYAGKKAVFQAEYNGSTSTFCPPANAAGRNAVLFDKAQNLDGSTRVPCE